MKDQYFGDVNDFRKYALLLGLSGNGALRTGICWMLTAPDNRSDGSALSYLRQPSQYRHLSPQLFDLLHNAVVVDNDRRVARVEAAPLMRNSQFYSRILRDDLTQRQKYFGDAFLALQSADWVFFDPDNGIEVPSTAMGRKGSSKFLYWPELVASYVAGKSVFVYQHFPRTARGPYVERLTTALMERTQARCVLAFTTSRVVFVLAPQVRHESHFRRYGVKLARLWEGQINLREYRNRSRGRKTPARAL